LDSDNVQLKGWISDAGLAANFHLLGARADVPRLMAALDLLAVASAFGESFPLVVGEAMACGISAVVTDVGDARLMVGDSGRVVPPRDPGSLATAVLEVLALDLDARRLLGKHARQHIGECCSLPAIVDRYQDLYDQVLAQHGAH
jgi:glycosyltransferase involved in cell wall biosynthesis